MKTITDQLMTLKDDFSKLVDACNRDGLHDDAQRAQTVVLSIDALQSEREWPDEAAWPPRVTVEKEGDMRVTTWRCVE